ncbi:hypothetical protein [Frigidibacter sp. SD6-1]|uniref:hypothetical protein n=1 Tax=Frigidibacter sp. SD6-1 TaxID=3032581 RepID=UPI0024E03796|nr:hypothetical protein [Frigidibacter sp. SD6-1]
MWRNALQANHTHEWEQQDPSAQVDGNLRRAYPVGKVDDLPLPLLRALQKLAGSEKTG